MAVPHGDTVKFGAEHIQVIGIVAEDHDVLRASPGKLQHAVDAGPLVVVLDNGVVRLEIDIAQLLREGKAFSLLHGRRRVELVDGVVVSRVEVRVNDVGGGLAPDADLVIEGKVPRPDLLRVLHGSQNPDPVIQAVAVEPEGFFVVKRPVLHKLFADHDAHAAVADHVVEAVLIKEAAGLVVGASCIDGHKMPRFTQSVQGFAGRGNDQARGPVCQCAVYIEKKVFFIHLLSAFPRCDPHDHSPNILA